ncbi:MAG: HD domain-containing protein [Gemmatimonadaceae bacterium]|nr:HD domain-containing protein [Gemmatimonadaceae bacterium]
MLHIRCPLYSSITVESAFLPILDGPEMQRLRNVRQLGLAHLVYPGATHSRFEHALGAYHLARVATAMLRERGALAAIAPEEPALVMAAAMLHDIGHYPFSHALEEIGLEHHESVAVPFILDGPIADVLRGFAPDAPSRVLAMIQGTSESPLGGLISGSIDLDKIDYLRRDARMCGVPYGEIDLDRLLHALVVVSRPSDGRLTVGIREKGLAALESLLFAKYQMYRNVYWHHAARSATAMYKRLVADALAAGRLDGRAVARFTDEGLLHALSTAAPGALLDAIRLRRLYKRSFERSAADLEGTSLEWIAADPARTRRAEDALAQQLGLAPGELLLDYPAKERMLGLDLPVLSRDGTIRQLTDDGMRGLINLPMLADEFYRTARYLRVLTVRRIDVTERVILDALASA